MALKVRRTFKGETSRTGDDKEEVWMFDVQADDLTFTVTQAKTAADAVDGSHPMKHIPPKGEVHAEDDDMICADIQAARDENLPTLIRVTVTWRSPQNTGTDGGGGDDGSSSSSEPATPVWNIELGFDREAYEEVRNRDLDNALLLNSAGDFFDPQPCKRSDAVYLYSYYVKNLDWVQMGEANECVNSEPVTLKFNGRTKNFPKHTLMIEPRYSVVQTLSSGDMIYKVEARLTHRKATWFRKFVDQGLNYVDSEGVFKRVTYNGQPASDMALLDGSGGLLADGADAILIPATGDGFRFAELLNFSTLPGFGG